MSGSMCSLLPYGTGICHHACIYITFFKLSLFPFYIFLESGIDEWNGQRNQHALALCALLAGVVLKGLTLQKLCWM